MKFNLFLETYSSERLRMWPLSTIRAISGLCAEEFGLDSWQEAFRYLLRLRSLEA